LVFVFFELPVQFQGPRHFNALIFQFGFIPEHLTGALHGTSQYPISASLLTIFTSMFLHADLFHIVGNLWFLWIFGDNIEDHLGHFTYLVFYLLCGITAALTFIVIHPTSTVPTLGASGAIAGVMGGYIVLYPRARVQTLVVLIVFFTFWWIPAWVFRRRSLCGARGWIRSRPVVDQAFPPASEDLQIRDVVKGVTHPSVSPKGRYAS